MTKANDTLKDVCLAALDEITHAISSLDNPRSVLKIIAQQVDGVMEVEDCSIMLLKGKGMATVLVSTESPDLKDREIKIRDYPEIEKVLETREPLTIADVSKSPLLSEVTEILTRKHVRSMIVLPVEASGEVSGILFIRLARKGDPLERGSLPFLKAVANVAALALRNLILKERVRSEVMEKEEARKLAEREEIYRQRYQDLFNAASDGILILDSRGRVVDVNRKFENLTGYSASDFPKLTYLDIVAEEFHETAREFLREYRHNPMSRRTQFPMRKKSGEIRHMLAIVEPLKATPGQALLALQDITEEKELANQLKRTKEFLENLVQNSADAIIASDMKGGVLIFNKAAERISGYKAEEVIGKINVMNFYAPGGAKDAMRRLRSPNYGGIGKLESSHYSLLSKSGEEIPVNVSASIIYEGAREIATMGIFQDLRERIRIEKELRAVQERLIETEKQAAIAELSGATAHELNQPLTSILGYAELLTKRVLSEDEKVRKAVETINQEAERMAEIVKKISHVSSYHTKDYVGRARIIDLERASRPPSRYENLFLSLRDGLLEFSLDDKGKMGECIFANPSAVSLFGFKTVSDLLGLDFRELLVNPKDISLIEQPLKKDGFIQLAYFRALKPDGSEIHVSASGNIVEAGKSGGIVELVCRDVTQRIEMENELRRLKELNENIINNAPVGIISVDKNMLVLSINDREKEIMSLPDKNVIIGRNLFELPTIKGTETEKMLRRGMAGEHVSIPYLDYITILGKKLTIRVEGVPLKDDRGQVTGGVILVEDVTEERRARLELEVIAEISRAATLGRGAKDLLNVLTTQLKRIFDFDGLAIVSVGEIENQFKFELLYAAEGLDIPPTFIIKGQDNLIKRILNDRISIKADDYAASKSLSKDERLIFKAGIRSAMVVPLVTQDLSLGSLNMGSRQPNSYTDKDLDFFRYVADEFAIALENAHLVEQLREKKVDLEQKSSYLETLLRAGRGWRVSMKETEIVDQFIENIEQLFPSPHLLVSLVEPEGGNLVPILSKQLPNEAVSAPRPVDPPLKGWIQQGHDYIYFPRLSEIKDFKPELPDAKSALIMPLQAGGELLGILQAESHHEAPFNPGDIDLFVLMAQQMSASIRNARLFEQAKHLERQQEELIENANALIAAVDNTGIMRIFNKAFEQFTGYTKDEVVGKRVQDLFKSRRYQEPGRRLVALLRNGHLPSNFVVDLKRKSGEKIKAVFNSGFQRDAKGKVHQYIFVGYDITERELLEKQLMQSAKMATLGEIAVSVAHELSNPLAYISSFAQILSRDLDKRSREAAGKGPGNQPQIEPKDLDNLKKILQGVDRIEKLISNLMSFSRVDEGQKERININDILEQALSFTEYELTRGKIKVIRDFGKDIPAIIGVPSQLQQLFINLLTNASHALREKGKGQVIVRSSSNLRGLVQVEVIDDGPGIPPQTLDHIFEPFFTTKSKGEGTGLGLSIAQNIVQKHGGNISVRSDGGAAFTVSFPAENV